MTHEHRAGTGRTVEWTEGTITRIPRTNEVKLPEPGVLYWATALADNDPLHARVQKDFGSALKPLLRPHNQEIARRTELRYVRFAKVAVDEHPHRIYYVFPALGRPKVVTWPSPRRT